MGNHSYNRYRRYGKGYYGGKKKKAAFIGGAVLVLLLVVFQFSSLGSRIGTLASKGGDTVASAFHQAVDWGRSHFGKEDTSFAVPVSSGVVVEEFGVVADADGKESYHKGIDIQVPAGSEVLAAADGKVSDVSQHDDGTYWVTVTHEQNWSTVYGRLGEASVAEGDEVKKGDVLGTPASEILHFEVLEDQVEKDPVRYFQTETDGQ